MVERVKNGKNGKIAPEKKCPRVPVGVRGGGVIAIWAMPTQRWGQIERGFPNIKNHNIYGNNMATLKGKETNRPKHFSM